MNRCSRALSWESIASCWHLDDDIVREAAKHRRDDTCQAKSRSRGAGVASTSSISQWCLSSASIISGIMGAALAGPWAPGDRNPVLAIALDILIYQSFAPGKNRAQRCPPNTAP